MEQVFTSYTDDTQCKELITKLSVDSKAIQNFSLKDGILRYKDKVDIGITRQLRQDLIQNFHSSAFGGHSGERATLKRLQLIFYWPLMAQQVKSFVQMCPV